MSCVYCYSLWISLIHDVQKGGKICFLLVLAVYAIVDGDKANALLRKEDFTDITYIPWSGSFLYLCVIMDAYTKQVLSYSLSPSLEVDFVLDAVDTLIREHGISLHAETVIHSDQGCHYTSCKFIELVELHDLRRSMSHRGNCWDNAPQESFFGHMKDLIDLTGDLFFDEVQAVIDDYMSYYNSERYQWDLAKLSPNEYFSFVMIGIYPFELPNKPSSPAILKAPNELGAFSSQRGDASDTSIP